MTQSFTDAQAFLMRSPKEIFGTNNHFGTRCHKTSQTGILSKGARSRSVFPVSDIFQVVHDLAIDMNVAEAMQRLQDPERDWIQLVWQDCIVDLSYAEIFESGHLNSNC